MTSVQGKICWKAPRSSGETNKKLPKQIKQKIHPKKKPIKMQFAIFFFLKIRFITVHFASFFCHLAAKRLPVLCPWQETGYDWIWLPAACGCAIGTTSPQKRRQQVECKTKSSKSIQTQRSFFGGRMWRSEKQGKDLFMPCRPATKYNSITFVSA